MMNVKYYSLPTIIVADQSHCKGKVKMSESHGEECSTKQSRGLVIIASEAKQSRKSVTTRLSP